MLNKVILFIVVILSIHSISHSEIYYTNNFWSTGFDSDDLETVPSGWESISGVQTLNSYTCGGNLSSIASTSTDAKGSSGNVFRTLYQGGVHNGESSSAYVIFPSITKEFWFRWYYRIPTGQTIGGILEHKLLYIYTDDAAAIRINMPNGSDGVELQYGFVMGSGSMESLTGGWATLYGNGQPADGSWHYYEIHVDMGTPGDDNGVVEFWIDGTRRINATGIDFFTVTAGSPPTGWESIEVPHNHNVFQMSGCNPHDIDELAVAVPGYSGFVQDANSRDMIGSIDGPPASSSFLRTSGGNLYRKADGTILTQ